MYGLVHRTVQCFAQDTYGGRLWSKVVGTAQLPHSEFESMLIYPDAQLDDLVDALSHELGKTNAQVCEDIGAYLVTHTRMNSIRRLLRFGGATYFDFVLSLDELHDRAKLALPELALPKIEVRPLSSDRFAIQVNADRLHFGSVLLGLMRAMADDYGVLAVLELSAGSEESPNSERINVELFDAAFAQGREFDLVSEGAVQ